MLLMCSSVQERKTLLKQKKAKYANITNFV